MGTHSNRVAVVTGAGSGIGQSVARMLAERGATVVGADVGDLSETEGQVKAAGAKWLGVNCDVSSSDDVAALSGEVDAAFTRCDILVNNAGIYPSGLFGDLDFETFSRVLCGQPLRPVLNLQGGCADDGTQRLGPDRQRCFRLSRAHDSRNDRVQDEQARPGRTHSRSRSRRGGIRDPRQRGQPFPNRDTGRSGPARISRGLRVGHPDSSDQAPRRTRRCGPGNSLPHQWGRRVHHRADAIRGWRVSL